MDGPVENLTDLDHNFVSLTKPTQEETEVSRPTDFSALPEIKKKRKRTKTVNDDAEELKVEDSPEQELEREAPVLNEQDVEELQRTEMER